MASSVEPAAAPASAANSHQIPNNSSTATQNHPYPHESKKRPLDSAEDFQNFPFCKMRAVLRDLRPLFLEVAIEAPDVRHCKAAVEIQEKMRVMLDLCRQMATETTSTMACNNRKQGALPNESQDAQKHVMEHQQEVTLAEYHQSDKNWVRVADERHFPTANNSEEQLAECSVAQGTYIVGGSAFGWNFITYHGTKPVYCGRTKESFGGAE